MNVVPGQGVDFAAIGRTLAAGAEPVPGCCAADLAAGQATQRRGAAHDGDTALRCRGQGAPNAVVLLRLPSARGGAQPGHQRRRQHPDIPVDDDQPADDIGVDRIRSAGDDADHFATADAAHRDHRAAVAMGDAGDRAAFSAHVRRAVGQHRAAQRAHRGDVQRLHHRQDLRSSCSCPAAVRRVQRRCVSDQLWGAVLFGSGVTGDGVHRQYQLCRGGGGRRTSGRDGSDHPRQYPGLHPVRPPVQPAADPGRRHVQHAAIRRSQRGAGVRAAR